MSKRARDRVDRRDWQKKWGDNPCPINWQAIGTSIRHRTTSARQSE